MLLAALVCLSCMGFCIIGWIARGAFDASEARQKPDVWEGHYDNATLQIRFLACAWGTLQGRINMLRREGSHDLETAQTLFEIDSFMAWMWDHRHSGYGGQPDFNRAIDDWEFDVRLKEVIEDGEILLGGDA